MANFSTVFYVGTLHMTIPSLRFSRFKSDGSRHGDSRSDSQKKVAQDNGRSGITHSLAFNLSTVGGPQVENFLNPKKMINIALMGQQFYGGTSRGRSPELAPRKRVATALPDGGLATAMAR